MHYWLILIPILSAFTAWITVRLLVYFIFRPKIQKNMAGFRIQGLLPANWDTMALVAGDFIAREFNAASVIKEKIADPRNFEKLRPVIELQIDDFLRHRLKVEMPMVGMFIGDRTIDQLKPIFINEIEKMFPLIMDKYSSDIVNDTKVESMVTEKIKNIPFEKLELILRPAIEKPLRKVSSAAFIFGLVIGIIQLLLLSAIKP